SEARGPWRDQPATRPRPGRLPRSSPPASTKKRGLRPDAKARTKKRARAPARKPARPPPVCARNSCAGPHQSTPPAVLRPGRGFTGHQVRKITNPMGKFTAGGQLLRQILGQRRRLVIKGDLHLQRQVCGRFEIL